MKKYISLLLAVLLVFVLVSCSGGRANEPAPTTMRRATTSQVETSAEMDVTGDNTHDEYGKLVG